MMAAMLSVFALIGERFKHIHAIPAFDILSFSRPVESPPKLFSAFYSTLKTPISPSPSFETTPIASFLLNECGFSVHDANAICRKRPDLFAYKSYDNSRKTLLFLRKKGVSEIGVRKLFSVYPTLLRSSFHYTVKPKVEFLEKIGVTGQKFPKTLNRCPHIFRLGTCRTMELRACFLQSVLDPELAAVVSNPESDKSARKLVSDYSLTSYVICRNPRILIMAMEKGLVRIAKDVEGMGLEKGSKAFARAFLRLSMANRDTVKLKLEKFRELGFKEEEVGSIIKRVPDILAYSKDTLRQKLKFLLEEWELPRNAIVSDPVVLHFSIEKRMKPRLNALSTLMMMNKFSKKTKSYFPLYYMRMTDGDFNSKVVSRLPVATYENNEEIP